ncbi:MAG: pyruvate kinase, partial [Symploca sp. SIO2G7]|nr:pyruvate kinase [Symploca sp. SIO2G7]
AAERHVQAHLPQRRLSVKPERTDQAIAMAAMITANNVPLDAIIALTESGSTAQWLSRVRSPVPIIALSPNRASLRRMRLFQHVQPLFFSARTASGNIGSGAECGSIARLALERVVDAGLVQIGQRVVLTFGDNIGEHGSTNTLKILRVPEISSASVQAEFANL